MDKKRELEIIGKVKKDKEYAILKDKDDELFCINNLKIDTFFKALENDPNLNITPYKIKNIVNNTILTGIGKIEFYFFHHEDTVKYLMERFNSQEQGLFTKLAELSEGADYSDIEKFVNVEEIMEWETIESDISFLGYDGDAYGFLIIKEYDSAYPTCYVQTVTSYSEGYGIDHFKVPVEVFKACQDDKVKEFFEKNYN